MAVVEARDLSTTYTAGDIAIQAIRGVSFTIPAASFVSFVGPSGSGKSTLLNIIGCLDPPTTGTLTVAGQDVATLSARQAARFRGDHIGFIFQDFNLIPVLTVFENVEYPLLMVQHWPPGERKQRVEQLLGRWAWPTRPQVPAPDLRRPEAAGGRGRCPGHPGGTHPCRRAANPGPGHGPAHHRPDEGHARRVRHHLCLLHPTPRSSTARKPCTPWRTTCSSPRTKKGGSNG